MDELKNKVEIILEGIRDRIIELLKNNQIDNARLFMDQYIRLSPSGVERFLLEVMILEAKNELEKAEKILQEGLSIHPLSFNLLYNLGYIFEKKGEILEAYNVYMKARYISNKEEEKNNIALALTRIKDEFAGTESIKGDAIATIVIASGLKMTLTTKIDELLRRKNLLTSIENNIGKNISSVLEVGFGDGIISKNLNYYGYDVTAVSPNKENILNVIAKEWQDNLLQPKEKVAKFYQEEVNIKWVKQIPKFDVIIAVGNGNLNTFKINDKQKKKLLKLLLEKVNKQLFIRVSLGESSTEFNKNELLEIAELNNLQLNVISFEENEKGEKFELCIISKIETLEAFCLPQPLERENSESIILQVELSKCTDSNGASYIDDWHHFVEFLKEYEENSKLEYEKSILKDYYERFTPNNSCESLFPCGRRAQKLRKGWIGYPWYWDKSRMLIVQDKIGETRPGGNHHFGPNTEEFGQEESRRLITLYDYIKKSGYHPEMFSDGYISGYLLIKDEDYRFVVTEGQHRIACLAALGYDKIRCRFTQMPEFPRRVDLSDIKKWPQVENGVYSRNLASVVFNRFFEEGVGRDRMFPR